MKALVLNCSPVRTGATAAIAEIAGKKLSERFEVSSLCIDDYSFAFCKGCRSCHITAKCSIHDGFDSFVSEFVNADIIACVSPSYWADVPGQFKAFIDRWTPWCDTHEPHATLPEGKRGYVISLRTGPSMRECETIRHTIEHFYGHLHIECCGSIGFCGIETRADILARRAELEDFCGHIGKSASEKQYL